jgi:hypothetical protein
MPDRSLALAIAIRARLEDFGFGAGLWELRKSVTAPNFLKPGTVAERISSLVKPARRAAQRLPNRSAIAVNSVCDSHVIVCIGSLYAFLANRQGDDLCRTPRRFRVTRSGFGDAGEEYARQRAGVLVHS